MAMAEPLKTTVRQTRGGTACETRLKPCSTQRRAVLASRRRRRPRSRLRAQRLALSYWLSLPLALSPTCSPSYLLSLSLALPPTCSLSRLLSLTGSLPPL
eukprot:2045767-Pleurochrysis_carterae.AAC.4